MSSVKPLREVVRQLADTFNNPQNRESSYFNFYDDSLNIHGFPPNLPANKEGFKQFIYLLWKAFPDVRITFDDIIIEGNKVACRYNLTGTHKGDFEDLQPTDKQLRYLRKLQITLKLCGFPSSVNSDFRKTIHIIVFCFCHSSLQWLIL